MREMRSVIPSNLMKTNSQKALDRALELALRLDARDAIDALRIYEALRHPARPRPDAAEVMSKRRQKTKAHPEPDTERLAAAKRLLE